MAERMTREQVVFELAAAMREAFAEAAITAHRMGVEGIEQADMLAAVVPACEPLVESFMRRVVVHDA